jgi:hypothetical protein
LAVPPQSFDLVPSKKLFETIATNPNTPPHILRYMSSHVDSDTRAALAENQSTPLDTLYQLACDQDPDVRYQLAENHNMRIELLRYLADDDNPYVACRAQTTIARLEQTKSVKPGAWQMFRLAVTQQSGDVLAAYREQKSVAMFMRKVRDSLSQCARATS